MFKHRPFFISYIENIQKKEGYLSQTPNLH